MRPISDMNKCALFTLVLATGTVVTGCASTDASASKIHAAGELGIGAVPQAAVHMQLAKEQMKLAEEMAANEQWEQAESMLKRAQADAKLARLLFQEEVEKSVTMAAVKKGCRLREHNEALEKKDNQSNERNLP